MKNKNQENGTFIKRIGGYLHKVTPVFDSSGKIINSIITPFQNVPGKQIIY